MGEELERAAEAIIAEAAEATQRRRAAGTAKRKVEAEDAKTKRTSKPKAPAKRAGSMAEFVDGLMLKGMSIDELFAQASAESKKRGIGRFQNRRKLDRHIANRTRQTNKWKVTRDGDNVKMTAVGKTAENGTK
jgi:hypothetical protein